MLVQRRQYRAAELEFRKVVAGNKRARGFEDIRTPDSVVYLIMTFEAKESSRKPKDAPLEILSHTTE